MTQQGPPAGSRRILAQKARLILGLVFLFLYVPFVTDNGFRAVDRRNVDLPSFYYAADTTFNDQGSPYRSSAWQPIQRELGHQVLPFLYPPPALLLLAPLGQLPYAEAKVAMLVVNHLSVLVLLYLLLFRIFTVPLPDPARDPDDRNFVRWLMLPLLVLYTLQFHPLMVTLDHGQINLTVLVLLCLFWLGARERGPAALIALPLAGAILLKTYPALFLPLLVIRRQGKVAAWAGGYVAGAAALSWLVLPRQAWTDWLELVLPTGGYASTPYHLFSPAMPWNQSLNGFTARLFLHPDYALGIHPLLARLIPAILALLILAVLCWLARRLSRFPGIGSVNDEFVFVLLSIFLVAPLSWEHHLVFVLPAALLALIHVITGRTGRSMTVLVGTSVFLMAWPMAFLFKIEKQGLLNLLISLKLFAVVGLWGYFLGRLLGRVRQGAADPS